MRQNGRQDPLPELSEKEMTVKKMFDRIAPKYDFLNRLITFRLDVVWRKETIKQLKPTSGSIILDVACGTGDLCSALQKAGAEPIGLDFSRGMLTSFNSVAPLINADALKIPLKNSSLDGATCGFALRNFVDIKRFLNEVSRVLKPGSQLAILEVDQPENKLMRLGHSFYFTKIVPFIGKIFSDKEAYRYLPRSVVYLPSENELYELLKNSGFSEMKKIRLMGGIAQLLIVQKQN